MEFWPTEQLLESARDTLDDLRRKHADALAEETRIADARRRIGFDAHTVGGTARKELDDLNKRAVVIAGETQSLAAAIEEGAARVAQAEAEVRAAAARARAIEVRDVLLPQLRAAGERCANGLDDFTAGLAEYLATAHQIGVLGGGLNQEVARVNLARSVDARLFLAGRLNSRPLDRAAVNIITIERLTEQLCATATGRIAPMLGGGSEPIDPIDDADEEEAA
jgi:hypothetical protein